MSNLPICSHFRSYKLQKQPVDGHTGRPGPRDPRETLQKLENQEPGPYWNPRKTGKPGPGILVGP